jgi:hypothetical protein
MLRARLTTLVAVAVLTPPVAGLAAAATVATHQLKVNIAGSGSGVIHGASIDCSASSGGPVGPCEVSEVTGNRVTLTASASRGSTFIGWSGSGCSGTGACTVTLNSNVTVTARFSMAILSVINRPLKVLATQRSSMLLAHCRGPGTCVGSLELSTVVKGKTTKLTSANYTLTQGSSSELVLKFSSSAIALIAKHGNKLTAQLTVLPNDGQPLFATRQLQLA